MNSILENVVAICIILVVGEIVGKLCPKNNMVQFVKALVAVVLLASVAATLFSSDINFDIWENQAQENGDKLSAFIDDEYKLAAEEEAKRSLEGLFAVAGLEAEKIQIFTDIPEDSSIVLTKISVVLKYSSDAGRAMALLQNTIKDDIEIEVKVNGS